MREIAELVDVDEPGWPVVTGALAGVYPPLWSKEAREDIAGAGRRPLGEV